MFKPAVRDLVWLATGAVLFGAVVVGFTLADDDRPAAEALAAKAGKLELVDRMRADLATASDDAQAAVVTLTDQQAQALAEAARAAQAALESRREQLTGLLAADGGETQRQRLADLSESFAAFRTLDEELLDLAVQHTNLKAYALLYGPAAQAVDALGEALAGLAAADGSAPDARSVSLALGARVAALRIQTLLAPHVAEESDARMDRLEAQMVDLGGEVQRSLDGLRAIPALAGSGGLGAADEAWAQFREIEGRIVALSRANTNVRSLAISLDRKRKLVSACTEALEALRQAIVEEPVPGAMHGPPPRPR
jgi:hypothetical protein